MSDDLQPEGLKPGLKPDLLNQRIVKVYKNCVEFEFFLNSSVELEDAEIEASLSCEPFTTLHSDCPSSQPNSPLIIAGHPRYSCPGPCRSAKLKKAMNSFRAFQGGYCLESLRGPLSNPSTFPIQKVKLRVKRKAVLSDKVFLALHHLYMVR